MATRRSSPASSVRAAQAHAAQARASKPGVSQSHAAQDCLALARASRARAAAALGRAAELVAGRFLESHGLQIVLRNFRRRLGEIDLVALDGSVLAIVEVRTRSSQKYGGAAASVDWRKQIRVIRATHLLLRAHAEYARMRIRFDVIVVFDALAENPQVQWIKDAFQER